MLFQAKRRSESLRLVRERAGIHGDYDGHCINLGSDERRAKLLFEPFLVGVLGCIVFWIYSENGWSPMGLPFFLLSGVFTLPFVERVKQTMWDRRPQAMQDARAENAMFMRDFEDRFGS